VGHDARVATLVLIQVLRENLSPTGSASLPFGTDQRFMNLQFTMGRCGRLALFTCGAVGCITAALADDSPAVTPYRPSVSTPAALSAPGWLEVEAGVQSSRANDPIRRESLPYTLKFAFTPDWGIRIGGDAIVRQRDADGSALRGGGDTTIVLKRRLAVNDASAFGIELGAKLPTAGRGLGSGHSDVGLNGIYSSDFAPGWHLDLNTTATHLGGVDAEIRPWQTGWASALSRNVTERWGVVSELSGTHQGGAGSTSQALIASSYSVSPAVTLDLGVSKGLSAASGGWSVFFGVTVLAVRLF
jgi:hypothetical protein